MPIIFMSSLTIRVHIRPVMRALTFVSTAMEIDNRDRISDNKKISLNRH